MTCKLNLSINHVTLGSNAAHMILNHTNDLSTMSEHEYLQVATSDIMSKYRQLTHHNIV